MNFRGVVPVPRDSDAGYLVLEKLDGEIHEVSAYYFHDLPGSLLGHGERRSIEPGISRVHECVHGSLGQSSVLRLCGRFSVVGRDCGTRAFHNHGLKGLAIACAGADQQAVGRIEACATLRHGANPAQRRAVSACLAQQ